MDRTPDMLRRLRALVAVLALCVLPAWVHRAVHAQDDAWHVAYEVDFRELDYLGGDWIVAAGRWQLTDDGASKVGRDADGLLVLRRPVANESVRIEYEAVAGEDPGDLGLFFGLPMVSTPGGSACGFVAFGSRDNTVTEVRLPVQYDLTGDAPLIEPGRLHSVALTRDDGRVTLEIDGELVLEGLDTALSRYGGHYIGLYAWHEGVFRGLRVLRRTASANGAVALGPGPERAGPADETVWWVAGDPHVGRHGESFPGEFLVRAVGDVNQLGLAERAVMLGDLVEDCRTLAPVFVRIMNTLGVQWAYVLGNHDFDRETHLPVLPPSYGGLTVEGVRFVFLSDELSGRTLVMSEEQERWFWKELEAHGDKPIVVFSHQPYTETSIWPRLEGRAGELGIAAWFHAHAHAWLIREDTGHGFVRVGIHSIGGVRDNDLSCFLHLKRVDGRTRATVRFRNHATREWIEVDGRASVSFDLVRE